MIRGPFGWIVCYDQMSEALMQMSDSKLDKLMSMNGSGRF